MKAAKDSGWASFKMASPLMQSKPRWSIASQSPDHSMLGHFIAGCPDLSAPCSDSEQASRGADLCASSETQIQGEIPLRRIPSIGWKSGRRSPAKLSSVAVVRCRLHTPQTTARDGYRFR